MSSGRLAALAARDRDDTAEFAAAAARGGKLAGLDVGTKTIGARHLRRRLAFRRARRTRSAGPSSPRISKRCARSSSASTIVGLVVGLPLNMDGSD